VITVGAYEAKTKLPELLNRVENGERITITRRGTPVAVLTPPEEALTKASSKEILARFRAFQAAHPLGASSTRELVNKGRRV
jgi:prevent-host-death family protein